MTLERSGAHQHGVNDREPNKACTIDYSSIDTFRFLPVANHMHIMLL
jgi:hypothetical protein